MSELEFSKRRAVGSINTALAHIDKLLSNNGEHVLDTDYYKLQTARSFLKNLAQSVETINVTLDRRGVKRG